ncbi:hypothetical protein AMJ44_06705 [candidate division WOR-1 bacterium DG_54_3]|uniref:Methyltransferase domain-containing protein n=1 Tax=candidate division WOR-1 bacterium DG_54_3 TaxID=1703775 RepID=A0A0S7Y0T2_UNCSA|nr:MAG: hypothetical protein AMJ44_06705 [candidate division WOR-1 bacterium DG_54_3]
MNPKKNQQRLYKDLAWVWPIISPLEDYAADSERFCKIIKENAKIEVKTMLHLGCGGGRNDHTFKKHFKVTGVDISQEMLEQAKKLNPEINYHPGDMRTVRLEKQFDTVAAPDSINYMTSREDLRKAFQTAFEHLKPGGVFLTLVEEHPGKFKQNKTSTIIQSQGDVEIVFIDNYYDPDPKDTTYEATFVYLIRKKGKLRIETDHHLVGIFALEVWHELLRKIGFEVKQMEIRFSGPEPGPYPLLMCIKP